MISFDYEILEYAKTKAPTIKFTLSDPLRNKNVITKGLVDTGYDGELLLSYTKYKELELVSFELPSSGSSIGETVTGERIEMKNSSASLELEETGISISIEVDTFKECQEILIGRRFLENFVTTLHGQSKKITLKSILEE